MTLNPKPRNGVGGWIVLALICAGGSTGGSFIRSQPVHNPDITTNDWNTMCRNVDNLRRDVAELLRLYDRLSQQVPQKGP